MNILQLLNSTYKLGYKRQPEYVFTNKKFGSIYVHNKMISYKPRFNIVEFTMYISAITEINKTAHRVNIAIKGADFKEITREDIIKDIKNIKKYNNLDDNIIVKKILEEEVFYKGKVILPTDNRNSKFLIINKHIPLTSEVRVRCSCADYYYTWSWYNVLNGVHAGQKPKAYIHKNARYNSDGSLYTSRNPNKNAGVCKHILLFFALLMSEQILNKSARVINNFTSNEDTFTKYSNMDIKRLINKLTREITAVNKERKIR